MKEIKFALYTIGKNIQSSAELRTSFLTNMVGMMINNSAFIIIWFFFAKAAGNIGGWTSNEVIGMLGFCTFSYGVIFSVGSGLRSLPTYITSGVFDRFMLSPKNLIVRTATSAFDASAVGDVVFGALCIVAYFILISATLSQILLGVLFLCLSSVLILGVVISIFSIGFFFTDSSSVTQGILEMFITPSIFHGGAFQGTLRAIFIFVIPALVVGTIPVETIINPSLYSILLVVILPFVWLGLSFVIFKKAVKKYESSNFMTFGNS